MHNTVRSTPPYEGNLHSKAPIRDLGHPIANTAAELLFGKNLIPDRLEGEDMVDALNRRNRSIDFKSTAANNLANHPILEGLGIGGSKGAKILGNIDAFSGGKVSDKLSPILGGSTYKATEDIQNMLHNPAAMSAFGAGSHSGEGVMNALGKNFYKRGSLLDKLKNSLAKKAEAQIAGNNITQQLGKLPSTDTKKSMTEELTSNDKPVGPSSEAKIDFSGRVADQSPVNAPNRSASSSAPAPQHQASFSHIPMGRLAKPMSKMARNTGISNVDGETYVNSSDVELLGKLGFDLSESEYEMLEKTSEVLDLYSYMEKVAGVPKEVAKLIDSGQAFSGEYLKDMGYNVPKGYEVKGDLCCPSEKTEKEEKRTSEKIASEEDYAFTHYNLHGKLKELRPLTYLELLKDRTRGRWENKPELAQKYVDDRKEFEATLGKELLEAGLPYDSEKSFLYGAVDGHERFGQPGWHQHLANMPDFDKTFFTICGLDDKDYIGRGKPGLLNSVKLWKENQDKLKDTEYMGMPIRPRVEIMTQESVTPHTIKRLKEKTAAANPAQTILVTGHSGSGKTTLAQTLAEKLGLPLHSVDKHPEFKEYVTNDDHGRWQKSLTPGTDEHKFYTDLVHKANKHTIDNSPAAAIIEGYQLSHMSPEELAKYKAHILVGGDPEQSIAQRIARSAKKKSVTFSPTEILERQEDARAVVKFFQPGMEKFKKVPGVINYNHTEHQVEPIIEQLRALMSKEASAASRRILDILKRAKPEKTKETLERLSLLGRYNHIAKPNIVGEFAENSKLSEKLKSLHSWDLPISKRFPGKNYEYKLDKALHGKPTLEHDVRVIPRKYNRHDIDELMRHGYINRYQLDGEMVDRITMKKYRMWAKEIAARKAGLGSEGKLLAQYDINNPNIKALKFTPHLALTDPVAREKALLANKLHPGKNSEWAVRPNYETVVNYASVVNPTKRDAGRLKPSGYFKPIQEGSPGSISAASLPSSYEGFMYKGGDKNDIQRAKKLKELFTMNPSQTGYLSSGSFYSGIPEVSAGYANQATHVIPTAGFRDLRRHLYPRSANREVNREINKNVSDYFSPKFEYVKQAASAAWQRSEGKNPEGGLNAKGRASYKRETGGTLKAPVTESEPKGERAKRQNSFCSRMCGMKSKNTGSKAQSDPDSRINKSLRKWNCKCGEDHSSLFEKVACVLEKSELEKEAMNLSYMKNAIRAARASGIPILRNEAQLASHFGENFGPGLKKIPFIGDRLQQNVASRFAKSLQDSGPIAIQNIPGFGENVRSVYIPKGFTGTAGPNYSPRAALLHELGHIEHFAEDPLTWSRVAKKFTDSAVNKASLTNLGETVANNNAINSMQAANVPAQLVDTYKAKIEAPFYNTYANALNRAAESPTGHMNLGQRFVHSAKQKGSDVVKNIWSKVRGANNQPAAMIQPRPPSPSLPSPPPPPTTQSFGPPPPLPTAAKKPSIMGGMKGMGGNLNAAKKPFTFDKFKEALANRRKKIFEPLSERPSYANPIAQEFNVPYSVGAPHVQKQGSLRELLKRASGRCWEGYEPVPGKEPYSDDSCRPKISKKKKRELEKEAVEKPFGGSMGGMSGGVGLQGQNTVGNNQPALRPTPPQLRPMPAQEAPKLVNSAPGSPVGVTNTSLTMSPGTGNIRNPAPINIPNQILAQEDPVTTEMIVGKMKTKPIDLLADIANNLPTGKSAKANQLKAVSRLATNAFEEPRSDDVTTNIINGVGAAAGGLAASSNKKVRLAGNAIQYGATGLNLARDYLQARAQFPPRPPTGPPIMPQDNYPATYFSIRPEQQQAPTNINIDSQLAKKSEFTRFVEYFNKTAGDKPVPGKEAYSEDSCRPKGEKKKKSELEKEGKQTIWTPPAGFNPFKKKPAEFVRPVFNFEDSDLYKILEKQLKMEPLVSPVRANSPQTGALARIKALLGLSKSAAADHPLVSSNIKAVGYDKKEKELEVAFHSGGEYKYRDVPRGLYARLLKVKSPGKFFHKHIKKNNKFEYEKMAGMPEHIRRAIDAGDKALLQAAQSRSVASRAANTAAKKRKLAVAKLLGNEEPKISQTRETLQKHFPFSVSHEFEQAKKTVDPAYKLDMTKYLGKPKA
jgi:cytidylate kinase